jgi:hypothetical protein
MIRLRTMHPKGLVGWFRDPKQGQLITVIATSRANCTQPSLTLIWSKASNLKGQFGFRFSVGLTPKGSLGRRILRWVLL